MISHGVKGVDRKVWETVEKNNLIENLSAETNHPNKNLQILKFDNFGKFLICQSLGTIKRKNLEFK